MWEFLHLGEIGVAGDALRSGLAVDRLRDRGGRVVTIAAGGTRFVGVSDWSAERCEENSQRRHPDRRDPGGMLMFAMYFSTHVPDLR